MKVYVFTYSNLVGTQDKVKEILDEIPEISSWRFDMTNSFFLLSDKSASELSAAIRSRSEKGRFLIVEIGSNRQGYLPKDAWEFIKQAK